MRREQQLMVLYLVHMDSKFSFLVPKGLLKSRLEKFKHFEANQSNFGDRCPICLGDFKVGNWLVELDCDGKHVLCKNCTYEWFSNHKTCPNCRHRFYN